MSTRFWVNYCVVLENLITCSILFVDYFSHDKMGLITQNMLEQCSSICQKAHDCIPHVLLIAKLEAYGLDKTSLQLLRDYLCIRKQRTRIGSGFSDW